MPVYPSALPGSTDPPCKQQTESYIIRLMDPKEFARMRKNHPSVFASLDQIAGAFTDLFEAIKSQDDTRNRSLLFLMVGASYREFEELLTLAMNGYGAGATKLLRALYERTVTTLYLMKHPKKIQQFIDFTAIHWKKLLIEADTSGIGAQLPDERRGEIERDFKQVEENFQELACSPCKKTRLQGSWTKKPVPTQAREINEELGAMCFRSYLMPTFFLHTTFWGIEQQTIEDKDGKFTLLTSESERRHAAGTLVMACNLMKHLAEGTNQYYALNASASCVQIEKAVGQIAEGLLPGEPE
jgi:hypothetical protein